MTDELVGRLFKDGQDITHRVVRSADNRNAGGTDIETTCGLRCNVIPRISLRKTGNVDCMGCLTRAR